MITNPDDNILSQMITLAPDDYIASQVKWCHLELMYHLGRNVIIWDKNVIIWNAMLSSGANVIIWDEMLLSGMKCYHLGRNVIIWDEMLSSGANVIN